MSESEACSMASDEVIQNQLKHTSLPRRFSQPMREIWALQARFTLRSGKRPLRLLAHPRFRAGYDFLLLRAEASEDVQDLSRWWMEFLTLDETSRLVAIRAVTKHKTRRRSRRRHPASRPGAIPSRND